jgi:hypothetical protein
MWCKFSSFSFILQQLRWFWQKISPVFISLEAKKYLPLNATAGRFLFSVDILIVVLIQHRCRLNYFCSHFAIHCIQIH